MEYKKSVPSTETGEMKDIRQEDAKTIDRLEHRKIHICRGCSRPITDEYILRVMPNLEWHTDCLVCELCKCQLGNLTTCYLKNEQLYCKTDYHRLFSRSCAGCNLKLKEEDFVIKVKTFLFHIGCFRCWICHDVLVAGDPFRMTSMGILCENHYSTDVCVGGRTIGSSQLEKHDKVFKQTRARTTLNDRQIDILQMCYADNPKPNGLLKKQLVDITGLPLRVIRVWFQNKRCKDRKRPEVVMARRNEVEQSPQPLPQPPEIIQPRPQPQAQPPVIIQLKPQPQLPKIIQAQPQPQSQPPKIIQQQQQQQQQQYHHYPHFMGGKSDREEQSPYHPVNYPSAREWTTPQNMPKLTTHYDQIIGHISSDGGKNSYRSWFAAASMQSSTSEVVLKSRADINGNIYSWCPEQHHPQYSTVNKDYVITARVKQLEENKQQLFLKEH